mgnify:CR=1 FL=1
MNKEFSCRLEKIEASLNAALSFSIEEEWKKNSFGKLPESVKKEHIMNLVEPNKNLVDLGGKRWRPLLLILCYELAKENGRNALTEEQFEKFIEYQLSVCERADLLGASAHTVDILKKS